MIHLPQEHNIYPFFHQPVSLYQADRRSSQGLYTVILDISKPDGMLKQSNLHLVTLYPLPHLKL